MPQMGDHYSQSFLGASMPDAASAPVKLAALICCGDNVNDELKPVSCVAAAGGFVCATTALNRGKRRAESRTILKETLLETQKCILARLVADTSSEFCQYIYTLVLNFFSVL